LEGLTADLAEMTIYIEVRSEYLKVRYFWIPRSRWMDNIKMGFNQI